MLPIATRDTSAHSDYRTVSDASIAYRHFRHTWSIKSLSSLFQQFPLCRWRHVTLSVYLPPDVPERASVRPGRLSLARAGASFPSMWPGTSRERAMQDSRTAESVHDHASMRPGALAGSDQRGDLCSQPVTNHASMRPGTSRERPAGNPRRSNTTILQCGPARSPGSTTLHPRPRCSITADLVPPSSNRQSWRPNDHDPRRTTQV